MRLLLTLSACCLFLLSGCSSLPKDAVETTEQSGRASMFLNQGHKYYRSGQYEKALASLEKALSISAAVDDEAAVAETLSSLGRSHLALGHLDKAQACFQQSRQAAFGVNQPELLAQALGGLGTVDLHRQQPQNAVDWITEALELPLDDPGTTRATLLHDLGSAHRKLGDSTAAESYFLQALAMHEPLRDLTGIAADCYSLALLYHADGKQELAVQNARRALNHDKRGQNPPAVAQDLTLLGTLSLSHGQTEAASDYFRRAKLAWQALGRHDQVQHINEHLQRIP